MTTRLADFKYSTLVYLEIIRNKEKNFGWNEDRGTNKGHSQTIFIGRKK